MKKSKGRVITMWVEEDLIRELEEKREGKWHSRSGMIRSILWAFVREEKIKGVVLLCPLCGQLLEVMRSYSGWPVLECRNQKCKATFSLKLRKW